MLPATDQSAPDDELDTAIGDDLLAELDLTPPQVPVPDGLDALDDLLSESVKLRDEEREAKAARERLRKRHSGSGRTPEEIAEDEARVREWELRNDWQAVANIALWEKHRCTNCGRGQTIFRQLMLKQQHRTLRDTLRWQQVDETLPDLPSENLVQKWEVGMCTHCAPEFGFGFQDIPTGEWSA